MTGNRTRFMVVSAVVTLVMGAASWVAAQSRSQAPAPDSLYKYLSVFTEVLGLVRQAYVKDTDVDTLMAGAYEGAADSLGPFTVYVPPGDVAEYRRVREHPAPDTGLYLLRERGWLYVVGVAAGSAAERAGFERGDLVSKIDGQPTRELQVWQIEQQLGAKKGETVPMSILRQGDAKTLQLKVEDASTEATTSVKRVREVPVLRIARFDRGTAAAVEGELQKLAKAHADKLAIDLRGVAGGDPEAAYQVADYLVSGDMGQLEARDQVKQRFTAAGEPLWKGRIVVLTDRGTLGAAEVLARVLDEGANATLVGEPTFGHAGHQGQIELQSGALVELTDSFYTGPKGKPVTESVEPDQEVDERSRTLREKDLSLDELILQRGVGALEKPATAPAPEQKAA
ncbi:MAG TPA: S41 family peptidase [Thermoanaerobaculia bacterium]|jgi:carboxyl-terminal processing protease|nr:S41 family peptidase [Thermoanaerobaculia bacterium]